MKLICLFEFELIFIFKQSIEIMGMHVLQSAPSNRAFAFWLRVIFFFHIIFIRFKFIISCDYSLFLLSLNLFFTYLHWVIFSTSIFHANLNKTFMGTWVVGSIFCICWPSIRKGEFLFCWRSDHFFSDIGRFS